MVLLVLCLVGDGAVTLVNSVGHCDTVYRCGVFGYLFGSLYFGWRVAMFVGQLVCACIWDLLLVTL